MFTTCTHKCVPVSNVKSSLSPLANVHFTRKYVLGLNDNTPNPDLFRNAPIAFPWNFSPLSYGEFPWRPTMRQVTATTQNKQHPTSQQVLGLRMRLMEGIHNKICCLLRYTLNKKQKTRILDAWEMEWDSDEGEELVVQGMLRWIKGVF
ncbi:uncharacterized protein LOC129941298 [Eupeodes corollae]|uniref:uncharacterized protein LOC129941298 n=1 Tax=Eupeodes corollae TaxID=290404 RepID=UPI002490A481|nr:uncharacterized protein LOC129941298 [Eupeodes corollae]